MNTTSKLLTAVVVLQALTLGVVLTNPSLPVASAAPADAGMQRTQIVEEQRRTNAKLDRIISIMESGNVQVKVAKSDEDKGGR